MSAPLSEAPVFAPSGSVIAGGRFLLPDWRRGITPNNWNLVQTNKLIDLDPAKDPTINPMGAGSESPWKGVGGQHHVVTAWSGGEWDESKGLHIWGGGHDDYWGNEKYLWDIATGLFVRQSKPSGAIGNEIVLNDGLEASGVYADGQPRSYHTYNNFAMRGGVLWAFGGSPAKNGGEAGRPFKWNGASWDMDANESLRVNYGGACYDQTRDRFYIFRTGISNVQWYDPHTKTKAYTVGFCNSTGGENKPFYNARRDIIFLHAMVPHVMSGGVATSSVAITMTGTLPPQFRGMYGAAYDEPNDRYLFWESGATIYVLTPPPVGENPKTAPWVWSTLPLSASNAITPVRAAAGTYGRFWYSPSLRCCGVVNAVSQNMHVFPLD